MSIQNIFQKFWKAQAPTNFQGLNFYLIIKETSFNQIFINSLFKSTSVMYPSISTSIEKSLLMMTKYPLPDPITKPWPIASQPKLPRSSQRVRRRSDGNEPVELLPARQEIGEVNRHSSCFPARPKIAGCWSGPRRPRPRLVSCGQPRTEAAVQRPWRLFRCPGCRCGSLII